MELTTSREVLNLVGSADISEKHFHYKVRDIFDIVELKKDIFDRPDSHQIFEKVSRNTKS